MRLIRTYTQNNGQSSFEELPLQLMEHGYTRSKPAAATSVCFYERAAGFKDFHPASRRQFMFYLSARVELGFGDGSGVVMNPGDALLAEDTFGQGHSSRVVDPGICVVVTLD